MVSCQPRSGAATINPPDKHTFFISPVGTGRIPFLSPWFFFVLKCWSYYMQILWNMLSLLDSCSKTFPRMKYFGLCHVCFLVLFGPRLKTRLCLQFSRKDWLLNVSMNNVRPNYWTCGEAGKQMVELDWSLCLFVMCESWTQSHFYRLVSHDSSSLLTPVPPVLYQCLQRCELVGHRLSDSNNSKISLFLVSDSYKDPNIPSVFFFF